MRFAAQNERFVVERRVFFKVGRKFGRVEKNEFERRVAFARPDALDVDVDSERSPGGERLGGERKRPDRNVLKRVVAEIDEVKARDAGKFRVVGVGGSGVFVGRRGAVFASRGLNGRGVLAAESSRVRFRPTGARSVRKNENFLRRELRTFDEAERFERRFGDRSPARFDFELFEPRSRRETIRLKRVAVERSVENRDFAFRRELRDDRGGGRPGRFEKRFVILDATRSDGRVDDDRGGDRRVSTGDSGFLGTSRPRRGFVVLSGFANLRRRAVFFIFAIFADFAGLTRFVEERRGVGGQKDRARQRQAEQNERSNAEREQKKAF